MKRASMTVIGICAAVALLVSGRPAAAADSPVGTWKAMGDFSNAKGEMTMVIERWGKGGAKLTYRMVGQPIVLTIESKLDGSDAPLFMNGQPTGETMALTRLDGHHASNILKMNGKQFGTSTATFSDDFSKLTIENQVQEATQVGPPRGKTTEIWTRK